jgi:tetratricopeptide (TPR) repeat protein
MLFDLQGKRRRMVQATYLILAVLMGGGLVLFGVGSGSGVGGLFDALSGKSSKSGSSSANSLVGKRITADEKALRLNPGNTAALQDLVRSHYQLATDDADRTTGQFGSTGKAELTKASDAWQRYVNASKTPDSSLASLMLNAYGELGLNQAAQAAQAAQFVALARPSAAAYLQLMRYASKAGQTRIANLAGDKALALAPKAQKKLVQQQIAALKASALSATTPTTTTGP